MLSAFTSANLDDLFSPKLLTALSWGGLPEIAKKMRPKSANTAKVVKAAW